jgi:pyrroloquinoline quinone biosynthesis protein E
VTRPIGLLAELTHRCPLACPYCSNPLALEDSAAELDTASWARVFQEAAGLGVLQVHLSGGEPASRRDLVDLAAAAHRAGLYTNLITSAIGLNEKRLQALRDAGLDHVQLSIQDTDPVSADRIAGYRDAHERKIAFARIVTGLNLALTINVVIHRANISRIGEMIDLAASLGAGRIEIAHAQYYGWALHNRSALMPTREQVDQAMRAVASRRGQLAVDMVIPDYYARRPKPCVGGWGRRSLNITPSGRVLPCHAAETIPHLEFWSVRDYPLERIWRESPAFQAFRGTGWMPEPCRSCDLKDADFGGCRCQAMAIAGDAAATDPACELSPHHDRMRELVIARADDYVYRGR